MSDDEKMGDVLGAIYQDAIHGLGIMFSDLQRRRLFKMARHDEQRVIQVNASCVIHQKNINDLFTFKAEDGQPETFWAKGLLVVNYRSTSFESLFWQQGIGDVEIEVHHRDALRFANLLLLNERRRITKYFETMDLIPQENWPIPDGAKLSAEMVDLADSLDAEIEKNAEEISINRRQNAFPEYDLRHACGFEFTGQRNARGAKVTGFRVDSSLASAWQNGLPSPEVELLACLILQTHGRIDPRLRAYKKVEVLLPPKVVDQINQLLATLLPKYGFAADLRAVPLDRNQPR